MRNQEGSLATIYTKNEKTGADYIERKLNFLSRVFVSELNYEKVRWYRSVIIIAMNQ